MVRGRVIVVGAGIAGLGVSLKLGRAGYSVTILDKDDPPPSQDPEDAFTSWPRTTVPQARQGHFFYARTRNLLLEHAPDVLDHVVAFGAERWNMWDLAAPEDRLPEDEKVTGLRIRRLPFERILRRAVEDESSVEIRQGTVVDDLEYREDGPPLAVCGVRLRDGERLRADIVIDASGRATSVPQMLAKRGVNVRTDVVDCGCVYYGRQFKKVEGSTFDHTTVAPTHTVGGDLGYLSFAAGFTDQGTCGMWLSTPPWDVELKQLRHELAWEAVLRAIPPLAPLMDPEHFVPITPVMPFGGQQNVLRHYFEGGAPVVVGLLAIGDSLAMTNPNYGWGASLALTHAFAAAKAIVDHRELFTIAEVYRDAVMEEATAYYTTSAEADIARSYRWRGEEPSGEDRELFERDELLRNGLQQAMRRDNYVLRVMTRRGQLVDRPDAIWSDEKAIATAREVMAWRRENLPPPEPLGPDRDGLLAIMARARSLTK